ncbi:MAG: hypothetical protein K6348_02160 [Deferribacterales bacterium]
MLLRKCSFKIFLGLIVNLFLLVDGYSYVYVYEVVTKDTRFQTASKLLPNTFWLSNGGRDVIKELKVVKVYADKDYEKALKDFKLGDENSNKLLQKNSPSRYYNEPYIWWR